jgi:hypothetical protein
MSPKNCFSRRPWIAALIFAMVAGFTVLIFGQGVTQPRVGWVDDWTHHHLVYSNPGTAAEALAQGRIAQWYRIVNDPRYQMQQLKRSLTQPSAAAQDFAARMTLLRGPIADSEADGEMPAKSLKHPVKKDWSMNLGSGTMGADQYPAKYSFSTTAAGLCSNSSTPDYVVYNTGLAGSNTGTKQANIIAYDNIYSGCPSAGGSSTVPLVYWSYYTGTGTASTSTVLSGDGTKVAFIESGSPSGGSTLRILKWKGGEGTNYSAPVAPDALYTNTTAGAGGNTAWSTCPSGDSCLISVSFQADAHTDTISAPWYDYSSDTLWVGDSNGYLHKFTNVFLGAPGEVTSGGWPVAVYAHSGYPLASPVYDNTHSVVFVGDFDGRLDAVSTSGGVTSSASVGTGPPDIGEAPLVDPVAGEVYLFVSSDTSNYDAVFQFPYDFGSGSSGSEAEVGDGNGYSRFLYAGTFDNAYFTSSSSSSPTGHLWVCGNVGGMTGAAAHPALYPITITSGAMATGSITAATTVSGANAGCSPVTEFCTNSGAACTSSAGTDYLFVSPTTEPSSGQVSGCTKSEGCVISYTISGATATLKGAGAFPGGAGGMIVDSQNTTVTGTLELYFGILGSMSCAGNGSVGSGTGGCAIQASQLAP